MWYVLKSAWLCASRRLLRRARVPFFLWLWPCVRVQLQWAFGQGAAELFIKFSDKVAVTVGAATLQAVVLLAFNQYPKLSVAYVRGLPVWRGGWTIADDFPATGVSVPCVCAGTWLRPQAWI